MAKKGGSAKSPFDLSGLKLTFADYTGIIVSVLILLYMWSKTSFIGENFVTLSHNATDTSVPGAPVLYNNGSLDLLFLSFAVCCVIVAQDLLRDLLWNRLVKRIQLRKDLQANVIMTCNDAVFGLVSVLYAYSIAKEERFLFSPSELWNTYPHKDMSFSVKLFYLLTLAYWLHDIPVMIVYQLRKAELKRRVLDIAVQFVITAALYALNFSKLGLVLLLLRRSGDFTLAITALLNVVTAQQPGEKKQWFKSSGFKLKDWAKASQQVSFVVSTVCKVAVVSLTIVTLIVGLPNAPSTADVSGNYNNALVRLLLLFGVLSWELGSLIAPLLFPETDDATTNTVDTSVDAPAAAAPVTIPAKPKKE